MGVVYEAFDSRLNRRVALKTLHVRPNEIRKDEERFIREGEVTAALPLHPHVVEVYETGIIEGKRYLAMEFIEGTSLADWRKTAPLRDQVRVCRDVAAAVHHAHEHDVIHRDLKPANVLIDAGGQPHVTDFGLAKTLGTNAAALTAAGMVVGSPTYMSPEQARGLTTVDRRADVYAIGVMLYETLAGRPPFVGDRPMDILRQVVRETVEPPSTVRRRDGRPPPDLALETICMKAVAKSPEERYPTAQALANALTVWLEGKSVDAETESRLRVQPVVEKPPQPAGRRGLLARLARWAGIAGDR